MEEIVLPKIPSFTNVQYSFCHSYAGRPEISSVLKVYLIHINVVVQQIVFLRPA
jgi:hypothetical protein